MNKLFATLGISMVSAALLAGSISGTVFAAGGSAGQGNCGVECPAGDGICNENLYYNNYSYASKGPNGKQNGKTLDTIEAVVDDVSSGGSGPTGPAPNSGDGIPDGSGFDSPGGPGGSTGSGSGPVGPAPNSGDCIPDGSGF